MCTIINESSKRKYERKYNCPYCDYRGTRENLVHHIDEEHINLIPKDFTPARVVFNLVNKKDSGTCIVCKGESQWNESAWRYDRICSNKCRQIYKKDMVDRRMINKYGTTTLLNDPEHQKKMLANRSISGTYKFSDGGEKSYTGSYEKNLLEFMDKVLNIRSKDIITPGPIYEYEYKKDKLKWITDLYYIPFNLVFDVKDGGSNVNTHPDMKDYRQKQIEKEKAIKKAKKHNYIRLTDNRFEQLINIMAEIKMQMNCDECDIKDPIVRINESMVGSISSKEEPYVYLLPYSSNKVGIEGIGLIQNLMMDNVFTVSNNLKLETKSKDFFKDKYYSVIEIPTDGINEKVNSYIDISTGNIDPGFTIELFEVDRSKILYEGYDLTKFNIIEDLKNIYKYKKKQIVSKFYNEEVLYECSIYDKQDVAHISDKLHGYHQLSILENHNGFFVKNIINNRRSGYYEQIDDIPETTLRLLEYGTITRSTINIHDESTDVDILKEAKEFPVQFDKEGNLLIKNMKKIDFEHEYSKSHKLLLVYDKNNSYDGMKYEISKLWFLNSILEKRIYSKNTKISSKNSYMKVRARILNDFNKYLKILTTNNPNFNFTEYYNNTPFSDATYKISKDTISGLLMLKKML